MPSRTPKARPRPGKALRPLAGVWTPGSYGEYERLHESLPQFRGLWKQTVIDGQLRAILTEDLPGGWHLSISFAPTNIMLGTRYPTWDEIADARYTLAPTAIEMVMFLPPPADYVNLHNTCFHLHEYPPRL